MTNKVDAPIGCVLTRHFRPLLGHARSLVDVPLECEVKFRYDPGIWECTVDIWSCDAEDPLVVLGLDFMYTSVDEWAELRGFFVDDPLLRRRGLAACAMPLVERVFSLGDVHEVQVQADGDGRHVWARPRWGMHFADPEGVRTRYYEARAERGLCARRHGLVPHTYPRWFLAGQGAPIDYVWSIRHGLKIWGLAKYKHVLRGEYDYG